MALTTRRPTGQPAWDLCLIAGAPKCGKTYAAAQASASDIVGRTFWFGFGEADPDEYGAIPGADFEIVDFPKTYQGLMAAVREAIREPRVDGKPNLIVLDSAGRIWSFLSDQAQYAARQRVAKKTKTTVGEKGDVGDEATIHSDLWNSATDRWYDLIDLLKSHNGPVIVTALLKEVTLFDANGQPTKKKDWKVEAQKNLPADAGVVVEIPFLKEAYVTGVRSLRFEPVQLGAHNDDTFMKDFTMDKLWRTLGLGVESTGHTHATIERPNADPDGITADAIVGDINEAMSKPLPERLAALKTVYDEWGPETLTKTMVLAPDKTEVSGYQLLTGWVAKVKADLTAVQEQTDQAPPVQEERADQEQPTAREDARTEQAPPAQPAHDAHAQDAEAAAMAAARAAADAATAKAAARADAPANRALVLIKSELFGQAATLGIRPEQHVAELLTATRKESIDRVPMTRLTSFLASKRPVVVEALRAQGRVVEADRYSTIPNGAIESWEFLTLGPAERETAQAPANA